MIPQTYRSYPWLPSTVTVAFLSSFHCGFTFGDAKQEGSHQWYRGVGLKNGSIVLVLSLLPPALRTVITDAIYPQWMPCDTSIHGNSVCRELQSTFVSKFPAPQLLQKQLK